MRERGGEGGGEGGSEQRDFDFVNYGSSSFELRSYISLELSHAT